ncbi:VacJ family lipoprotein [Roseomonas sp. OT10]|uniref:MlaA family lipoprotein n=1 Tax=Roseomonas cutis TaxID=2897332 RepID=UPI001E4F6BAB|nr:VacJ family lipoprotein [Roseomonas sp. OT10]UFN47098.1 VacJ family lipoprotein [Roseomonas sp. OT10]
MPPRPAAFLLAAVLATSGCATRGTGAAATPGDPLEPLNRQVFDVNLALDDAVIRPVALGYRELVPEFARRRVRSAIANLQEPGILANNLLQGRFVDAGHTTLRFAFNSIMGLGGLFDVATEWGIARRSGDFGQTLHAWGVEGGPYLMLPLLGPSNARDTMGWVGDGLINPVNWLMPIEGTVGRGVADGIDLREQNIETLDALRGDSLDFYARLRSVWQQRRAAQLGEGGSGDGGEPDVLEDPATLR